MASKLAALFSPLTMGGIGTLSNRIIMAPLTRCRAVGGGHVPNQLMAEYYRQRASGGLLITEATMVTSHQSAFCTEPGLFDLEQVVGWKAVTDAVHSKGGRIVAQLWHGGRACHPSNSSLLQQPVAPSPIPIVGSQCAPPFNPHGKPLDYVRPKELSPVDIDLAINTFASAARNAMVAGFDGVEVHGANGYLIDEFLRTSSNKRTDEWGGSIENRARFLLSVVESVGRTVGFDRVGVRLSPLNSYNDMEDEDPVRLTAHVASKLNDFNIAYLHMMRGDFFGKQNGDVVTPARDAFKNTLIVNMGFSGAEAADWIEKGKADAVAFGTAFLANPDLPRRLREGHPLNTPDPTTFYARGAEGYTTYPALP